MDRKTLTNIIAEHYSAEPEYLWASAPDYAVFRHSHNRKWFAVIMDVPGTSLGLHSREKLDIANFKCDPFLIGSLLRQKGFFPAYHMNKSTWISVALDSVSDDDILMLLDMSFGLTE